MMVETRSGWCVLLLVLLKTEHSLQASCVSEGYCTETKGMFRGIAGRRSEYFKPIMSHNNPWIIDDWVKQQ